MEALFSEFLYNRLQQFDSQKYLYSQKLTQIFSCKIAPGINNRLATIQGNTVCTIYHLLLWLTIETIWRDSIKYSIDI